LTSHRPDTSVDPAVSFFGQGASLADAHDASSTQAEVGGSGSESGDGYDDLEDEFAPQPRRKLGKLTLLLVAVLVAGLGVIGGVELQKHYGTTNSTTASGFPGLGGRGVTGGTGGFPGGGAWPGAAGNGSTGAAGSGGSTGTSSTATTPAVIGQISSISGQTMVVKNLGGKEITVHLTNTTTITKSFSVADLAAGQTVTVAGTTGTDSTITATSVTVQ
jgi:hypothetical protein